MDSIAFEEYPNLARLVEITSDAVALCEVDGTVLHVNKQLLDLMSERRDHLVGCDIKDILFSETFERAEGHRLPFSTDGSENTRMLKLSDGSFIPVSVRSLIMPQHSCSRAPRPRVLLVIGSLEERYAHDRQTQRLMAELKSANKRLSGTLSVIMSTVGSSSLPELVDTVLNKLVETLEADGSAIYFSESGGFKLRGASQSLWRDYLPDFIPYGAGISTHVLRESRACRLSVAIGPDAPETASGVFYDIDARTSFPVRLQDIPPFKTMIAVPVFFGTQILGVIELGWRRPTTPRVNEVRVLEVVCDYLSIELVGLLSSMRSQRAAELARLLNSLRDLLFAGGDQQAEPRVSMVSELRAALSCRACPILFDQVRGCHVIDFEGGSRIALPGTIDELFFSSTAPASRANASFASDDLVSHTALGAAPELRRARLVRIDRTARVGSWLHDHGLPCQGVFIDVGFDPASVGERESSSETPGAPEDPSAALAIPDADGGWGRPFRMLLLLRDDSQEPFDDMEYDFLLRLIHDLELFEGGMRDKKEERRIAQTLQAGMRSSLGEVPGITSDALYSSATQQALVGGDFYTLIRLPDDRAVMILGDVSGKGVEAASMSALVKTALTAYAWEGRGPAALARALNSMLMGFSRVETFATMFIAKIDLRSGNATYCSAGHPPSMVVRPPRHDLGESGEVELLSVQSGVVGAFEGMVYEMGSFSFNPGDMLFMYTDGAIEARDAEGGFFGERRLRDVLLRESANGIEGLCGKVLAELDEFTGSALDDDIALVALRFDADRGAGE
ncbi:MAG: SpoIIE family protein phosphatase [Collinsella sp.]|nr:SpoIIE family protein phosphatase [Collinsella sp.]